MAVAPRRTFLQTSAALGIGGLAFLESVPSVRAEDTKLDPKLVRLDSGIEPLVQILEETPRDKLLEEVGSRIKKGLAYREVLAALLLAGVRNIQPRPNVGFKFHAVLVVNSAHQAAMAGPDKERWLPLFWAIDNFKNSQATNIKEGGWRMKPVEEKLVPVARNAKQAFIEAMTDWDEAKADVAAAALARHSTEAEAFDLFARFGCRDYRDIGHKIIYVANAFRTLQVIGWHHAEPVLRSLAFAILKRDGAAKPTGDAPADKVGIRNGELARKLGEGWRDGITKPDATDDLLAALRTATDAEIGDKVVTMLNSGVSPQSVWDAVFLGAGELLMRQPGILGLHTLTTANALRYSFGATGNEDTRKLLLLQAASFLPLFRGGMGAKIGNVRIDKLEKSEAPPTVEEVFAAVSKDKSKAATLAMRFLDGNPDGRQQLIDAGRLLVFLKGTDSHDYKFSASIMEDVGNVSPRHRDRFLAASLFWLKGSGGNTTPLVARTRAALV